MNASQHERRRRILDAARALASRGGYDAVQMRDVADRAEVALGTLYRYFPSKVHLLLAVMHDETDQLDRRLARRTPADGSAADRVEVVLREATASLQRDPQLADALTRALMTADAAAAREVDGVTANTTRAITRAMGATEEPSDEQRAVARVLEQVWLSTILAWLAGRASASQMNEELATAVRLLVRE